MSDINIGTVSSEVRLNLTKLEGDVSEAKAAMASLAASLVGAVETFSAKMTQDAQAAVARESRQAEAAVARMAQQQQQAGERALRQQKADLDRAEAQAKQAQERALAGARRIGTELQTIGAIALGALGMAVKAGADLETKLVTVANNTTMTTADIKAMEEAVKSLGRESGADLGQLADGFMHASNFGFNAAESTQILTEAMKSAVSTGSDVGKTTEILANVMHEFSIKSGDASKAMNVLHLAAAQGNATLEQFVDAGGPAFAMAANLKVGMTETAAAMSALTKHGFTAAEAATQVKNILKNMYEPVGKAKDVISELSKATGVDLVRDFSLAGLHAKGMAGILDDVKEAASRAHVSTEALITKLIPAMRGGIGAMALAGTAAKDFKDELKSLADAMAGKVDPTTEAYARQQATLTAETNKAKNELVLMAGDIEKALLPVLKPMVQLVKEATGWFDKLSPEAKEAASKLVLFAGAAALITGTVLKTIGMVAELKTALMALTGFKVPALGLAEAGTGAAGLSVGVAGAGLFAAGGGLAYMANRTVWSGVKEEQDKAFAINQNAQEQSAKFSKDRIAFLNRDIAGLKASLKDYEGVPTKLAQINTRLSEEQLEMVRMSGIRDVVVNHKMPKPTPNPNANNAGDFDLNKWMKDHDTGGGSGGGGASGAADAIKGVNEEIYKLTHSDFENQMRDAWEKMNDAIREGVPALKARMLYTLQLKDIEKQAAEERAKLGGTMAQQVARDNSVLAMEAQRENDAITGSIRQIVSAYTAEAVELESVKQASDDLDKAMQQMFDTQLADMVGLMEAQKAEADATAQYWKDEQDAQEATFRARIEQSSLAAKALQDENDSTKANYEDSPYAKAHAKTAEQSKNAWKNMAKSAEDILGGAFTKIFTGDTKNLFGTMLKEFEQLLAQMAAKALAAGIMGMLLPGGGGFIASALGSLGGFDDAGNDRTARHWGFDFASMFSQGMNDHSNSRMAAAVPGGSSVGGDTHIHINMHGPVVRQEADISRLADQVARQVRNALPGRPGNGSRR